MYDDTRTYNTVISNFTFSSNCRARIENYVLSDYWPIVSNTPNGYILKKYESITISCISKNRA